MARGSSPYLQYAVVGVLGLLAYNWAESQQPGTSARKTADQLKGLFPKTATTAAASATHNAAVAAGPAVNTSQLKHTTLVDYGHFPVVFDLNINALRQDPALGGSNIYGARDSFYGPEGMILTWTGRAGILQGADGSTPAIDQFFVA